MKRGAKRHKKPARTEKKRVVITFDDLERPTPAHEIAPLVLEERKAALDRLIDQELAMLSQRYLRNLRREAAIVRR